MGERSFDLTYDDLYGANLGAVFEPGLVRILAALTPRDALALDVGANIGLTTFALAQLATAVHAFEVVPGTFELLETNVSNAGVTNVVLHQFGLGDTSGPVSLNRSATNRSGAYISTEVFPTREHVTETGRVEALDAVASGLGLDRVGLIKIDVEGFEVPVLHGARGLLERDRPVVLLEMNHWCLNAFQRRSIPDFLDDLRAIFPVLYAVDDATGDSRDLLVVNEAHHVMHEHIVRGRYVTVVGAFTPSQVAGLQSLPLQVAAVAEAAEAQAAVVAAAAAEAAAEVAAKAAAGEAARAAAAAEAVAAEAAAAADLLEGLHAERDALERELAAMRRTLSWRITTPLRAVRAGFRPATAPQEGPAHDGVGPPPS